MADSASVWLDDHLGFAVPLRMAELLRQHRATGMPIPAIAEASTHLHQRRLGITIKEPVWDGDLVARWDAVPASSGVATMLAARGDVLIDGSKPGAVEVVSAALVTALAVMALIADDGVTWRGHHWCSGPHCADQARLEEPA